MNTALVVSTFDGYRACWAPFCYGLKKYWPDCPFPVFFITNELDSPCGTAIKVGQDKGWSPNLQYALSQLNYPYIIYAQEDYWLDDKVNTLQIIEYIRLLEEDVADHIRLYPAPLPNRDFHLDHRLGIIDVNAEYRVSLQMCIWRRAAILDILPNSPDGWHLERNGSIYTAKYGDRFLSVKPGNGISYTFTAIINGRWSKIAYEYAAKEGINVDFDLLQEKPKTFPSEMRKLIYKRVKRPIYKLLGRPKFLR